MSKGAQLEGSSLEWLMQLKGLEDGGVKSTNRVLAVGAQNVLNDLQGAYKKLQDSKGDSNRYVAQQASARLAAISDLLPSRQAKQLIERQQRDLAAAQAMGGKAGVDLMRISKDGSLTLKENAKPNVQAIENAGKRLKDFWAKENTTFRDRVTALTQVALAEGKSYRSLAGQVRQLLVLEQQQKTESQRSQRVNQKMGVSQRAEVIARTEMQTAFVQGQIANYRQLGYEWARWSAAAERTCGYCMSRDGLIYEMEEIEGSIPAHPRCRCTLIPVEKPAGLGDKKPSQLQADDHLDDAYWQRSRKKKLDEWKADPRNKGIKDPKTENILNNMLRAYERTPTNQQQYLRPGSDAPKAKWKPSDNTIPDLVAAQKRALAEQQRMVREMKRAAGAVKETPNGPEVKEWKTAPDTVKKHSSTRAKGSEPDPNTVWTKERQALHNKIIDDFLKSGVAVDNPAFIMSGGGPASGKGFMLKAKGYLDAKGNPKDGYVVIDSDAIKALLPEYKAMQEAGGAKARAAAGFVHEESSYLAKRIMAEGAKRRFNIVLDGTGDNGIKSLKKKVDKMKEQGYRVEAKYVSADVDVAAKRNWDRFITSGRLPPEFMLRNVHADVSRTLPEAMKTDLFDSVELFDTNKRGDMRLVAHKSKGKKTVIDNKELWDDFTRKGEAPQYAKADNEGLIQQQISKAKQDSTPVKPLSKAQQERYKAGESLEEILGLNKPVKEWEKAPESFRRHSNTRAKGAEPGPDTQWTAERAALHDEIVAKFLASGRPSKDPTFVMSGGGPASGKGYMLKKKGYVDDKGKPKDGYVVIDSDEIKGLLPEYKQMQDAGGAKSRAAAGYVHEESSYLAKRIMREAADLKYNVVLDGTGDNGLKSLAKKVNKMKEQGYRVEAKYVSADTDAAARRNWDRFITSGRLPPEFMLRNVHADVSKTLPDAMDADLFDSVELFDTNKRGEMRQVAHKSKGKKTVIDNDQLWKDFTNKADAPRYAKEEGQGLINAQMSKAKAEGRPVKPLTKAQQARYKNGESLESILALPKGPVKVPDGAVKPETTPKPRPKAVPAAEPAPPKPQAEISGPATKNVNYKYDDWQALGYGSKADMTKALKAVDGYVKDWYDPIRMAQAARAVKAGADVDAYSKRAARELVSEEGNAGVKKWGARADQIEEFIRKAPKYDGDIYRGMNFSSDAMADQFIARIRSGAEELTINSWSVNQGHSAKFAAGSTSPNPGAAGLLLKVRNKSGAPVSSLNPSGEGEVLTGSGVRYRVVEVKPPVKRGKTQVREVVLEEIPWVDPAAPVPPVPAPDVMKPPVVKKAPLQPALQETGDMIGRSGKVNTDLVKADPERFQYKVNANKSTGEVGSLKGVSRWNEELAGVMSVWRDPVSDQLFVINGHNRLALAKRMGVKEIPVLQIKAANATEARMIGAKQNIASGDGTAIDAAKFMRDSGLKASDLQRMGMNLKAKVAKDGAALANLPDHIFTAAVEGRLPLDKAAAIGRSGLEPAQMDAAYKVLKTRQSMPPAQIDELLAAARASQTRTKSEQTLFGTDEVATTNMVERAKLAAQVKADLKKQVSVLEKAARNAEQLKAKGNRIDVNKAELKAANARAQLDVFDLQKNRPGSQVNKLLNDAATAVQDAGGRGGKAKATKAGKDGVLDALDADIKRMQKEDGGVLRAVADLKAKEQGRKAKPPELELEQGRPDLTANDIPPRFIDPAKAKAGTMGSLLPSQVQVDADRFQYKATTERSGEVGSLEGVSRYDRNLAGVISVWKDPANGQTYVINGHNRLAAAKRLGADAVEVRYIKASTAEAARGIGAMANIAEGHGTAIDAAKWIRSTGLGGDGVRSMGLAMKKDVAIQGVALSNLSDDLWRAVIDESISIDKAAAIGGAGLDADGMANVAKVLKHRPNASVDTVRELVAAEKASMEMGTTGSLFGEDTAAYQMERAQLTRDMRRDMLKDKALFGALASNRAKAELEGAGSSVDVDANRRAAAEQDTILTVYDQLKNSSGPVADALSRGARALDGATTASDRQRIQRQTREEISQAVQEELGGLVPGQTEMPPEAPGQESLF